MENLPPSIPEMPKTPEKITFTVNKKLILPFVWTAGILVGFGVSRYAPDFAALISRTPKSSTVSALQTEDFLAQTAPIAGVALPVKWEDLGAQMLKSGVIDEKKFRALYAQRSGISPDMERLLTATDNGTITITRENAPTLLNLLWALGLGNKNEILEKGPMMDKQYGGAGKFASTGGWTLAAGDVMNHYSRHPFMTLTPQQQELVARVAKNIYRPCCGNPTHFPDCNHGMAMLGLLELMAAQGADEATMYRAALATNAYWFPDNYATIAKYLRTKNDSWATANPKELLGYDYSSSAGYQNVLTQVEPEQNKGASGCGA